MRVDDDVVHGQRHAVSPLPAALPAERTHREYQRRPRPHHEHHGDPFELPRARELLLWKLSGRNTDRMPWQSHLSGKSAAICCIHGGISLYVKNTPEVNCRTSTTGETSAGAPRPVFAHRGERDAEQRAADQAEHAQPGERPPVVGVGMADVTSKSTTPIAIIVATWTT